MRVQAAGNPAAARFPEALIRIVATAAVLYAAAGGVAAAADAYPSKPIRMIVAVPPGGPADTLSRLISPKLSEAMGQAIVIDNRAGANGNIAYELTARAVPDGYTFTAVAAGVAINPGLYREVKYDPVKDLAPVAQVTPGHMLLAVSPATPFRSVKDIVDYARQNPDRLSNASSGNGTPGHVGLELFKYMTGTRIVHIPYKGGAAGTIDLIAGQVQLMMESSNSMTPHVKSGKVRGLAVSSATRSQAFPELPTIAEAGVPGYEVTSWNAILAPAGTPKDIITKLNTEINKIIVMPDMKQRLIDNGFEPVGGTPEKAADKIHSEIAKWAPVVKAAGIKVD